MNKNHCHHQCRSPMGVCTHGEPLLPMSQVHHYIHLPKTGGTAIKYALQQQAERECDITISIPRTGHNQRLANMPHNVCFIVRHPLDRFCSGFWERATMPERKHKSDTEYKHIPGFGYKPYSELEKTILAQCSTPDQFLTYIRTGGETQAAGTPGLFELTASLTHWLGNMASFKQHEHKIKMVYHINQMTQVMQEVYGISLPTDPFRKRSRALFDKPQSYEISAVNRIWFEREYRTEDYELIAYFKTRPYWYTA